MRSAWFALGAAAALAGCGGGGGGNAAQGTCTPSSAATIAITSSGISPTAVCVLPGGAVTFRNDDSVSHDVEPMGACPALNLGRIAPGSSATATFSTSQTCTFEDADHASDSAFQGTVAVSSTTTTGPGY